MIKHPPKAGRPGLNQLSQEAAISILRGQYTLEGCSPDGDPWLSEAFSPDELNHAYF